MATTVWGSGLSGDEVLAYAGHVELTASEIVGAALQDAQNITAAGANDVHYYGMDNVSPPELVDGGTGVRNLTLDGTRSWLTGANAWLGAASIQFGGDGYAYSNPSMPGYLNSEICSLDFWFKRAVPSANCWFMRCSNNSLGVVWVPGGWFMCSFTGASWDCGVPPPTDGEWHHVRFTRGLTTRKAYLDGVEGGLATTAAATAISPDRIWLDRNQNTSEFGAYAIDMLRISKAEHTDGPGRYKSGSAVLTKTAEASARKVTAVDWTGTFGANSGSLYRVQVNVGTDGTPSWTTVGGDNPTSPITGLDLTVAAGTTRWARVYLNPKADATKSATPVLSALRLTHASVGGTAGIIIPLLTAAGRYHR